MTDDMNLGLKAEGRHIEVINPSDRLPDLKGQQEIIIADLRRQLAAAGDKDPKLKLVFAGREGNESQLLRVRLERPSPLDETAIKLVITEKKLALECVASAYREQQAINSKFWPVEKEIAPYLKAIPGHLSEYEEWLREDISHNDLVSRTIKIKLVAANLGRGPAEGVHVLVHVPDGPEVHGKFPERPKEPEPLEEPLSPMDAIRQGIGLSVLPRSYLTEMPKFDLNSSGINIKKVNSYEVAWSTRELNHGLPKDIATFYCEWPSIDEAKSFTMDYTIHARNLSEPATGQLPIVIERA
jgi:hypothetical protein